MIQTAWNHSGIVERRDFAFVIPVYNHAKTLRDVLRRAKAQGFYVYVVDDGSTDSSLTELEGMEGIALLRHEQNRGKGAALITGMKAAMADSKWVITLDADGQHDPADALGLVFAVSGTKKRPIVVGRREKMMNNSRVPWGSRIGRRFSNLWVSLAGGPKIKDSQSGFRIYPIPEALNLDVKSRRFQFEVEILVKAAWNGIPVKEVPVDVDYPVEAMRISHFRPLIDSLRNAAVFTRLLFSRFVLIPLSGKRS